jgi:hypothetical protein
VSDPILSAEVRDELRAEAKRRQAAGETSLATWVRVMAREHGVSPHTIYRVIKDATTTQRKRRSDRGTIRVMDEDGLLDAAAMVLRHGYDAENALDVVNCAREQAGLAPYGLHVDTLRAHLRRISASAADNAQDKRVHRRWEAPYPGYLWQMDSTVGAQWYVDGDGSVGWLNPIERSDNKALDADRKRTRKTAERHRIWLLCIVDDHSRTTWAKYYTANNASAWQDMLLSAMRPGVFGPPDRWPAFGVPEHLYSDQDAALKASETVALLQAVGVNLRLARPSDPWWTNAQAKGKVERMAGTIIRAFEPLSRARKFASLAEINEALTLWLLHYNRRVHSVTGMAPFARSLLQPYRTQLPPRDVLKLEAVVKVTRRVSNALVISLLGKEYQLPRRAPFSDLVNETVEVRYHRSSLERIVVMIDGDAHQVDAVEAVPDVAGEFHAAPKTTAVETKEALLGRDLSKYDGAHHAVLQYRLDRQGDIAYPIRPTEVEHPLTAAASAAVMVRRVPATARMQAAGVVAAPPTPAEALAITALFAGRDEIPDSELAAWIDARRRGADGDAGGRILSLA